MPVFNHDLYARIASNLRCFVEFRAGVVRGNAPHPKRQVQNLKRRSQATNKQLTAANQKLKAQRRSLSQRNRQIQRLQGELARVTAQSNMRESKVSRVGFGTLPDFLVIGAEKAGTTFLYSLLQEHPHFRAAAKKEVHYLDSRKFEFGPQWYRAQFPLHEKVGERNTVTGEASPYYLLHPLAAKRAYELLPDVKLIVLLRNPIERAYSGYQHKVRDGVEPLSFEAAIEAEPERLAGERDKIARSGDYYSNNYRWYSYLTRGIYVDQIKQWHEYFAPEQFMIIQSEDFFEEPVATLDRVCTFVGLQPGQVDTPDSASPGTAPQYAPIKSETRNALRAYFEPHNRSLYEYLGVDFGWV